MKILLVFPPNIEQVEPFKSAKTKPPGLMWGFPLGLGYLAAVLKQNNFEVSLLDACFDNLPLIQVINAVKKFKPEVVGIGSLTHTLRSAIALAQGIKQAESHIKVVLGGPHATYDYENLLNLGCVDYVVLGEGEETFLELCEKLKKKESMHTVKGLAFLDSGKIEKTPTRPLIDNLDCIPLPDRELVDFKRYIKTYGVLEKSVDIMSSRGCTNRCAFCSSSHFFGRWRTRSPENIVREIKMLVSKYPEIKSINFMDDNFTADRQRVLALCDLLISENLNSLKWVCLARVDQLDEQMASRMNAAGCLRVHLGIESGSPEILKNINKRISLDQARAAVSLLKKAGIEAYSFFMIGHPGETSETIHKTTNFAKKLKSTNTGFFISQIFPGTRLAQLQPVTRWSDYLYEPEIRRPSIFTHPCVPNYIPAGFNREKLKKINARITKQLILMHFSSRYHLFLKKFITEPKATFEYLSKVFFQ